MKNILFLSILFFVFGCNNKPVSTPVTENVDVAIDLHVVIDTTLNKLQNVLKDAMMENYSKGREIISAINMAVGCELDTLYFTDGAVNENKWCFSLVEQVTFVKEGYYVPTHENGNIFLTTRQASSFTENTVYNVEKGSSFKICHILIAEIIDGKYKIVGMQRIESVLVAGKIVPRPENINVPQKEGGPTLNIMDIGTDQAMKIPM